MGGDLDATGHAQLQQALAFHQKGDLVGAAALYEGLLARYPHNAYILQLRGIVAGQTGNFRLAMELLSRAAKANPGDPAVHCNLGNVHLELKQHEDAVRCFDKAVEINPSYAEAYSNRGNALMALRLLDAAIASYDKAVQINPRLSDTFSNRGYALQELNRFDESLASFDRAISLNPRSAEAYTNRGYAKQRLGQLDAAIADYDRAIAIAPEYAEARWNKSLNLLVRGNFDEGWQLHEWRWRRAHKRPRELPGALWLGGTSLQGKTILLYGEQGFGDTVQFCRYAPLVTELGARVVLEVQPPLVPLLRSLSGVAELIERGSPLPKFDVHCPLLSLPLAFKTGLGSIPGGDAYLYADEKKTKHWSARLGTQSKPRAGIVWSGSIDHKNDLQRSIPLEKMLQSLPSTYQYFSLQKEVRPEDASVLGAHHEIVHFGADLVDFSDTASLCSLMDIVISVDTSVAHVSAAIGKTTFLLLPNYPDWRWLLNRSDSPWYSALKIFRQSSAGGWDDVLRLVVADLNVR